MDDISRRLPQQLNFQSPEHEAERKALGTTCAHPRVDDRCPPRLVG